MLFSNRGPKLTSFLFLFFFYILWALCWFYVDMYYKSTFDERNICSYGIVIPRVTHP